LQYTNGNNILSSDIGIRAIALAENTSEIVSVSDSYLQTIQINCVLDFTSITVKPLAISVVESNLERIVNNTCWKNQSEGTFET
jgi:hypothetical protein